MFEHTEQHANVRLKAGCFNDVSRLSTVSDPEVWSESDSELHSFIFYCSCVEIIWEYMYMHCKLRAVQLHVVACVHALNKTAIFHALHTNTSMTSWRKVEKCSIGTRVLVMVVEAATRAAACWDKPATTREYSSTPPEQLVKHGDVSPLTAPCKFNVDVCWG